MILGFKEQFVQPILEGTKIHTIREDSKGRWNEGNSIQFATGVRTKNYNQFKLDRCKGIQSIFMTYTDILEISIDDIYLYYPEKLKLAINDGFDSTMAFEDWFIPKIKAHPQREFYGKIIHWTDFKY
jgi:hypothetical protein